MKKIKFNKLLSHEELKAEREKLEKQGKVVIMVSQMKEDNTTEIAYM